MQGTIEGFWKDFARCLIPHDPLDVLASLSALQLIPENAGRQIRLEAAANIAATLDADSQTRKLSPSKLRRILNEPPMHPFTNEDPPNNLVSDEVMFIGGA